MRVADVSVANVMTPTPRTVYADARLSEAVGALLEGGFRHLPVVDNDEKLVGILSERDLRTRLGVELERIGQAQEDLLDDAVSSVMIPDPIVVRTEAKLVDVLDAFTDERIGALPVVDDEERVVGILSYVDVLLWLRRSALGEPAASAQP